MALMTQKMPASYAKILPFRRAEEVGAGADDQDTMPVRPLRIFIRHTEPGMWDLQLTTLFVDRLDFDAGIAALREQRIERVVDLDNKPLARIADAAGFNFAQTRAFVRRLQTTAKAQLAR